MKTLCIDFDKTIHDFESGWLGIHVIPDDPVRFLDRPEYNSLDWLRALIAYEHWSKPGIRAFQVCIYSSRSRSEAGIAAMKHWFEDHGLEEGFIEQLHFPMYKPAAFWTIDDRCTTFKGTWIDPGDIYDFKPWGADDE